jgi:hypothetical protein
MPKPRKRPPVAFDWNRVTGADCGRFFSVSKTAIQQWLARTDNPCPRNHDGTYSLPAIVRWKLDLEKAKGEKGDSLRDQKTKVEIERIQSQINKIDENYILRTEHDAELRSTIAAFPKFYAERVQKNYHEFVGQTAEQCHVLLMEFGRELMKKYAGIIGDADAV